MNRLQLHELTRSCIHEVTANQFLDANVNYRLDEAYRELQAAIRKFRPEAFRSRTRASIVANQARYGSATYETTYEYRILSGAVYVTMKEMTVDQLTGVSWESFARTPERSTQAYFLDGDELVLVPTPVAAITNGLECLFYDAPGFSGDSDSPRCPTILHPAIAYRAARLLLAQTDEPPAGLDSLWQEALTVTLSRAYAPRQPLETIIDVPWRG